MTPQMEEQKKQFPAYRTIAADGEAELVEKKSRFLAEVHSVESEEEVQMYLEETRKKYWDARHVCYAYVLGRKQEICRAADDGEPGGTAGRPMLDVLLGEKLCNCLVMVTRYFGGVLLGTGGLVRAYSGAAVLGLQSGRMVDRIPALRVSLSMDYSDVGTILYRLGQEGLVQVSSEYTEKANIVTDIPVEKADRVMASFVEATAGRIQITEEEICYLDVPVETELG